MRFEKDAAAGERRPTPKKSLGQHFLKDAGMSRRIVELAEIAEGDQVMEIGPGPGALTGILRPLAWKKLMLLEKDDHYAAVHAAAALPGLEVRHMDAMLFPWEKLSGPWKIVGNLPYNVASPLMWDIAGRVPQLEKAVFMIQKEVADRILAKPGNKTYGGLTVWIQSHAKVRRGFNVPPGAFFPPPRVDSSVIVMEQLPEAERPKDGPRLSELIKNCFRRRRKQLNAILREAYPKIYKPDILEEMGIEGRTRPEELDPMRFQALAEKLRP